MDISEKYSSQISHNLLSFFIDELGGSKIDYEIPPSRLQGGYDTSTFQFKLKNAQPPLSRHLVLRIFRKSHPPRQAIMERVIHNSLADQGLLVPYVFYACIDDRYLGSQFLIMDFLTGALLPAVFGQETAIVLGKTHAALHGADPNRLSEAMIAEGFEGRLNSIQGRLDHLRMASERFPWLAEIVSWLIENRPPDCEHPSICHGDFHPHNLLAQDGEVTAMLDWSSCRIGDPAMDVASTLVIFNAATKHLIQSFDSKIESKKYLDAYRDERNLNERNLGYYQVLFCVLRLLFGGIIWSRPPIRNEFMNIIYEIAKIRVEVSK